jgi:hypothetical protein
MSETPDVVTSLREIHREPVVDALCREAADEIVRLRSRLAQAREALIEAEDRLAGVLEGRYPNASEAALDFIRATLAAIPPWMARRSE